MAPKKRLTKAGSKKKEVEEKQLPSKAMSGPQSEGSKKQNTKAISKENEVEEQLPSKAMSVPQSEGSNKKRKTKQASSKKLEAMSEPEREVNTKGNGNHPESEGSAQPIVHQETQPTTEEFVASTETSKRKLGGKRSVCAMHKVVVKKAQGKKFKVRYDARGNPIGKTRHTLSSYVGMLARTMVPISIRSWPNVEPELKEKLWNDVQVIFVYM